MRLIVYLIAFASGALIAFWKGAAQIHEDDALPWVPLAEHGSGGTEWELGDISGPVQKLSPGGEWGSVADGGHLREGEELRTGEGGRFSVKGPGEARLALFSNAQIAATRLSDKEAVFQCIDGLVAAIPGALSLQVRLRAQKGEVSGKGRMNVLCGPDRDLVLAGGDGVNVKIGDNTVALSKLEVARVEAQGGVAVKEKLEDALVLQAGPLRKEGGAGLVAGTTSRSARVFVGDIAATVDPVGRFAILVPAHDLSSATSIHALDVAGRQKAVPLVGAAPGRPGQRPRPRTR